MKLLDGKIALITGASRGLGAALAEALAPSHHILAVARTSGGDTRSKAGVVDTVDLDGVWIEFHEALARNAT